MSGLENRDFTGGGRVRAPAGWRFENSYLRLPAALYERCLPVPVRSPGIAVFNRKLAEDLGLDRGILETDVGAAFLSGNRIPEGAEPIAQAYAGHQFGHFTMLGDGRAILLGEHLAPGGARWDIQLKGSGTTPFSRRGDGRATFGPMLREFVISEAMHALGIPTTRSLAVVTTGETVFREEPLPGAVLTRVAASHIRVGTFEYAAAQGDDALLRALSEYTLRRHFPECADPADPAARLLECVIRRQASLLARWMLVGFVHGVMNTDNMALSGETIDFGPCAFLDAYDPSTVFSSIDAHGRYAYANQPDIAHWNLARLAESLLPLLDPKPDHAIGRARELLDIFPAAFRQHRMDGLQKKIGLIAHEPGDEALAEDLLAEMARHGMDFTNTFRNLRAKPGNGPTDNPALQGWLTRWRDRLLAQPPASTSAKSADDADHRTVGVPPASSESGQDARAPGNLRPPTAEAQALMQQNNPAIIPRNHLVEEALDAAVTNGDLSRLHALLLALESPYADAPGRTGFLDPPPPGTAPYRTFCGT